MAGQARSFDFDENETSFLSPVPKDRVTLLRDASLPSSDLAKTAQEATISVPVVPAVPEAAKPKEASAFSTGSATPVELDRMLIEKYGIEWLRWGPETIWQTVRGDFNTQVSSINRDKIMAAQLLHVSDSFWRYWETFEKVVLAFNNVTPFFDRRQDVTVGQILHAIFQANEIRKEPFEEEVLSYIAAQAKEEGLIWLPPPADAAQEKLDAIVPKEISPLAKEVRERWDAFEGDDLGNVEFKEDFFGIQLARLSAIEGYLKSMTTEEEA